MKSRRSFGASSFVVFIGDTSEETSGAGAGAGADN